MIDNFQWTVGSSSSTAPTITNFTPTSGPVGTSVTITGTNFASNATVSFNGTASTNITFTNNTSLTATVPAGATSGPIRVTVGSEFGSSSSNFTIIPPTIATNGTLTPFSTTNGTASASQSFTVNGTNLTANITATAPASFEVSTNNSTFGPNATITQSGGNANGTVHVRLAASAAAGTPSGNITLTSAGAAGVNVAVNGTVSAPITPVINISNSTLTGFSTKPNAASANQSLTVSGSNLEGLVTLNASAGYEVSLDGITYSSSLSLVPNQPGNRPSPITIASDNAANYGGGWTNGSNSGFGFSAWQTPGGNGTTGFNGFFIGAANATQFLNHAAIYTGGNAFSVYAGGAGGAFQDATRPFASRLLPGQTLTHSMAFSFDNGNKGFNLLSGTTEVFNFNINNGGYSWTGGNAAMTSWPGVRERGVVINFTITRTPTGFSYSFNSTQDSNLTRNGTVTATGVDTLKYYISDAGGGDGGNIYFNNLQITSVGSNLTNSTVYVRLSTNGTVGPANGTLTFTSANATTRTVSLAGTITPLTPPVITSRTINGTVGSNFTASINATFSPTSHTANGTLPPGVTFNATTGNFAGVPTTVGNYTVAVTAINTDGTGSGNLTFAIAKGTPLITTPPSATPIFINQSFGNSTLSGGVASVNGTFAFTNPALTFATPGNYTANVTFTPSDSANWNNATTTVTVNVADISPPVVPSRTVNGTVGVNLNASVVYQNPADSFTANGSVPGISFNPATGVFSGTPSTAGNFSVRIAATNQFGEGNGTMTFNIARGNSSISVTGNNTFLYTALPQGPDAVTKSGSPGNVTFSYAGVNGTTYTASPSKPANVGNYTVTATLAGDSNYNSAVSSAFAFAITPRAITITAGNQSKTYGSTAPTSGTLNTNFSLSSGTLAAGESISGLTLSYNGTPAGNLGNATVGSYTIRPSAAVISGGGASNYNITYMNGTLTVNRAALTITAGNQTVPFGTPAGNVTAAGNYTATGFMNGETATVISGNASYTTTHTATTAVGAVGVTITPVVTGLTATNYSFTPANGTITIIRATPVIITSPTASAIGFGQSLANSTLTGGNASTPGTFAFSTPASIPNAGTSNQTVTFTPDDAANFNSITLNVSVTVSKSTPLITSAPNASLIFLGQSLSNSLLTGGSVIGGGATLPGTFSFNSPSTKPPVGTSTHLVIFTPTDSVNWNTVSTNVTVLVSSTPAAAPVVGAASFNGTVGQFFSHNITATNAPLSYGSTALPAGLALNRTTGTISGIFAAIASNFTTTVNATNGVGTGNATLRFDIAKGTPTITVPPVAASVSVNEPVGSPVPALSGGETNPPLEGTFTYANATQSFPAAGNYTVPIVFTPQDSGNWNTAAGNITVQVQQLGGNLTISANPSEVFEGDQSSECMVVISHTGLTNRDVVLNVLESPAGELEVDLSGNLTFIPIPSQITIPAGSDNRTIYLRARQDSRHASKMALLTVTHPDLGADTEIITILPKDFTVWNGNRTSRTEEDIRNYAIGGALAGQAGTPPVVSVDSSQLSIQSIIRTHDPKLSVIAETSSTLSNGSWLKVPDENILDVDLRDGTSLRTYILPLQNGESKKFLRFRIHLQQ